MELMPYLQRQKAWKTEEKLDMWINRAYVLSPHALKTVKKLDGWSNRWWKVRRRGGCVLGREAQYFPPMAVCTGEISRKGIEERERSVWLA
jgi:hypothetical protein